MSKTNNVNVAHNFFYGTISKGSNFYSEINNRAWYVGKKYKSEGIYNLYSYGDHFICASYKENGSFVFVNSDNYSSSTSKHMNYTRNAVPSDMTVIECPEPEVLNTDFRVNPYKCTQKELRTYHSVNIEYFKKGYTTSLESASRSRKYGDQLLDDAEQYKCNFFLYMEYFKINVHKKEESFFNDVLDLESIKTVVQERTAKAKKASERKKKAEKVKAKKELKLWLNGESDAVYSFSCLGYNYMRVIEDEKGRKIVQTSGHVKEPLCIVKKWIEKYLSGELKTGENLNHYKIIQVSDKNIKIGCHTFEPKHVKVFYSQIKGL